MRNVLLLLIGLSGHTLLGQPAQVDPRIRIRALDDVGIGEAVTELSDTVYVDEIGSTARAQLNRVEQMLSQGQYAETVDMLMRLLESDLRKVVEMDGSVPRQDWARFEPLQSRIRSIIHRLANESASNVAAQQALAQYHARTDPLAKKWFEKSLRHRDESTLRQLLTEAPHSRYRAPALLLLADMSLARGQFDAARRYYRLIEPSLAWPSYDRRLPFWIRAQRGEDTSSLAQQVVERALPHQQADPGQPQNPIALSVDKSLIVAPSDIAARLVLVSILEGNRERAATELAILKTAWPQAAGAIGGIRVPTKTPYRRCCELVELGRFMPIATAIGTAFAGSPSRNSVLDVEIDIPLRPVWQTPLPEIAAADPSVQHQFHLPAEPAGEAANRPCAYFPVVVDNVALIKEETRLRALDVRTGKAVWAAHEAGQFFEFDDYVQPPAVTFGRQSNVRLGQLRFLISAAHAFAVATFGARQGVGKSQDTALVGFDLRSQGALQFGPILTKAASWSFHGAPLNDEHRCWVGMRSKENATQDYLACFNVVTGEELWRTRICSAEALGQGSVESTSNFVLTKYEDTIYVSSHLGTVAAVLASTGDIRWIVKYPRRGPRRNDTDPNWYATRDLTPCLIHGDLVIAAPSDTDRIIAMHQDNGEVIWETTVPRDVTQLLGVGQENHLILSGRRVWWLDVYTGRVSERVKINPFPADATSEPTGVGRGLLSAGKLYWPAWEDRDSKIYVLNQATGRLTRQPIDLSVRGVEAGNLILTNRHLLVASPRELSVFELAK